MKIIKAIITMISVIGLLASCNKAGDALLQSVDSENLFSAVKQQSSSVNFRLSPIDNLSNIADIYDIYASNGELYVYGEKCLSDESRFQIINLNSGDITDLVMEYDIDPRCIIAEDKSFYFSSLCTGNEEWLYRIYSVNCDTGEYKFAENESRGFLTFNEDALYYITDNLDVFVYDSELNLTDKMSLVSDSGSDIICSAVIENDKLYSSRLVYDDNNESYTVISVYDLTSNEEYIFDDITDMGEGVIEVKKLSDGNIALISSDDKLVYINIIDRSANEIKERYEADIENFGRYFDANGNAAVAENEKIKIYDFISGKKINEIDLSEYSLEPDSFPIGIDNDRVIVLKRNNSDFSSGSSLWCGAVSGDSIEFTELASQSSNIISGLECIENGYISAEETENGLSCFSFNSHGQYIQKIDLDMQYQDQFIHFYNENYYIIGETGDDGYQKYSLFSSNGRRIRNLSIPSGFYNISFFENNSECYAVYSDDHKIYIESAGDERSDKKILVFETEEFITDITKGNGKYDLLIETEDSFYGYSYDLKSADLLLSNISICGKDIDHFAYDDKTKSFFALSEEGMLYFVETGQSYEKHVINIAVFGDVFLPDMNIESETSDVVYKFTAYENINDLNLKLISGETPDVFITGDSYLLNRMKKNGVLCNLNEFADSDCYIDNLKIYSDETNDIYAVYPFFELNTCIVKNEDLAASEQFGYDCFERLYDKYQSDMWMEGDDNYTLLKNILPVYIQNQKDYEYGKIQFNTPEFVSIIKSLKEGNKETYEKDDPMIDLKNRCVTSVQVPVSFVSTENITFAGYPSSDGGVSYLETPVCFAVSENCRDKDEALKYISYFFSDKYQEDLVKSGGYIPVEKKKYKEFLNSCEYLDSDELDSIIRSSAKPYFHIKEIEDIVLQEVNAYFEDEATAESVAGTIEKKVKLYLSENE